MLYALGSNGTYIRCYRCDHFVPKPKHRGKFSDWLRLGR
jgi:hypothetical protein